MSPQSFKYIKQLMEAISKRKGKKRNFDLMNFLSIVGKVAKD